MHECDNCGQMCDCDGEDLMNDAYDDCRHDCEEDYDEEDW